MRLKRKIFIDLILILFLLNSFALAQPAEIPQTFCNPLNLDYRFMVDAIDAREAADPVMVLFKGDYYLFASRSGGYWTSEDLRTWKLIAPTDLDVETYAPGVIAMRDSLFYIPSNNPQIYKTGDPKSGVWVKGPSITNYGDPAFFLDDDGKLYMCYGLSNTAPLGIVELDPVTFEEIGSRVDFIYAQAATHGWERRGDDNLLDEEPWIEGSWMIKENGKYYMHYAGPGTEFKTYADGIYVADSPKGPYEYAPYSPFSFKPTGFIAGAGHGSTFKDKNGQYWRIATMTISIQHMFERRLGLFPVDFDEDGHIRCNTAFGDYPQYFPGVKENHIDDNFAGMLLLSYKKYVMASSSMEDHGIEKAVDEDARTYWCASSGNADEWMIIDLGKECSIEAIQVNFGEHDTDPEQVRGRDKTLYEQYTIEISGDGKTWEMLVDKSQNMQDVPQDYIELAQSANARYVKLNNIFTPGGGKFAVRDLRIFGNSEQAVFTDITDFTVERDPVDGRDAILRWAPVENADGYIVRYGVASDKLYNNYMVYDADSVAIHSLNHGVEYFWSVEAFDSGTDYYSPLGELRSFKSGNWNDTNTWAKYDGATWVNPSPEAPAISDGVIKIADGHTVTVNTDIEADQVTVSAGGTLVIEEGGNFHVKDAIGLDLMVEGNILNSGTITSDAQATISFIGNSVYEHLQDGGTIPTAIWKSNSTCKIGYVKEAVPGNGNQNFHNIVWDCPEQTGNLSLKWDGNTIGGNITIINTGSGRWQMCAPSSGETATVTINGDIIQSGGKFTSNGTGNANTTITIRQNGSIDVTGGNFSVSRGSQGGSGTTSWYLKGNLSITNATTQNSNSAGTKFILDNTEGTQILSLSGVSFGSGGLPVEVANGATLEMGTTILAGSGIFTLKAGATFLTSHVSGLDSTIATTGTVTFEPGANFGFNGSSAQVTGNLMPDVVNNLVINNPAGITLSKTVTVNGILEMIDGALSLNGSALSYGPEASLQYSGSIRQTTTDVEFPVANGPKNLIITNSRGVILHASRTIAGNVDLSGRFDLEINSLTAGTTSNASTTSYIIVTDGGSLTITSMEGTSPIFFPVGINVFAPVWITNYGVTDTFTVGVEKDTKAANYGGRVRVKWNISGKTANYGNYALQFGWLTSLEDTPFRTNSRENAAIFNLADTTEVGTGDYTMQFEELPHTIYREGITKLGTFAVGKFREKTDVPESRISASKEFVLSQNYPNPFNPVSTIKFTLPEALQAKLVVYDILGKEITTLANGKLKAGVHTIQWNAAENASGIYIYKLITNDFVQAKKMILLK